ncbi:MAG: DUF4190 domain-containing protein [Archangiaceae bacterium]|nr:DUF4190 domain-containing protein [Archangiaceae bacterium]
MATQEDGKTAATTALVSGALGLTLIPLVGAVVAIIAGHLARRTLPKGAEGRRQATIGLVLGYLGLAAPALLIGLGHTPSSRAADVEAGCVRALETPSPFAVCSQLISDVALASSFQGLTALEPSRRLDSWAVALKDSATCRMEPKPALCSLDPGGSRDELRRLSVEAFLRSARSLDPQTTRALEAALPRHLQ